MEIRFTPTLNSLEISARRCISHPAPMVNQVEEFEKYRRSCAISNFICQTTRTMAVPLEGSTADVLAPAEEDSLRLYVKLLRLGEPQGPDTSDEDDEDEQPRNEEPYDPCKQEVVLVCSGQGAVARGAFHLLQPNAAFLALIFAAPPAMAAATPASGSGAGAGAGCAASGAAGGLPVPKAGDVVRLADGRLARVTGDNCRGAQTEVSLHRLSARRLVVQQVEIGTNGCELLRECSGRNCLAVVEVETIKNLTGLPSGMVKSLLSPAMQLEPWVLGIPGNYAHATSLDRGFLSELLHHGFFFLPGESEIFPCPFPLTPFMFKIQEAEASSSAKKCRGKKVKRYRDSFEITCNSDFAGHLRMCAKYHAERSGEWISEPFIAAMVDLQKDPNNGVQVYAFELWDKATGKLAAASFSISIGCFFHDFTMCTLMRDHRSPGHVLSKTVRALLADCGCIDWYWGIKIAYMEEYISYGAVEVPRKEYYRCLRSDMQQPLKKNPEEVIKAGLALLPTRSA